MPGSKRYHSKFEDVYLKMRAEEGWLFTDSEAALLPHVAKGHVLEKEWMIRKKSCCQLIKYLSKKRKSLNILEVGCGNGWLSNQLADIKNATVLGLDINVRELQQANRVFGSKLNINFICGDLSSIFFGSKSFDAIIFAAAIQYFSSFHDIIKTALSHLKKTGEIHIIDSHFYKNPEDVKTAKQRTASYFSSIGHPQMEGFYFHHSLHDLDNYNYKVLRNPNNIFNKLARVKNPFPWICIKH